MSDPKPKKTRKRIACFEIFLLVMFSFSISYLINDNFTNALETGKYCCAKTKNGALCQEISDINECEGNPSPTSCDFTDFCKLGCCISGKTGICDANTPRMNCSNENFKPNCNVPECRKGCCKIGGNTVWTTEKNCNFESELRGISSEFNKEIKSEIMCVFEKEKDKPGACVLESENAKTCKYTTLVECNTLTRFKADINNPNFYPGKFCSDPSLNTSCKARDRKACVEGKEDIYWFDSCGNPENIYKKCEFLKEGRYCGLENGEYICRNVNCIVDGKERKNGESWCEYDGSIGDGKDTVGSRHVRHVCFMGEEKIEPCADYRNEICVQKDTKTSSGGTFSQAACKVNNWRVCYSYNQLKDDELTKKCEKESDCYIKNVEIDKNFKFKVCLPRYPPGFSFDSNQEQIENKKPSENLCSIATQTCTETWKWCLIGGWKCIDNCNCHQQIFTTKMNELCTGLGDCGAKANYAGIFTDGGYSLKAEKAFPPKLNKLEVNKLISYSEKPLFQKPAEAGNLNLETQPLENLETISDYTGILAAVPGALGSPLLAKILSSTEDNLTKIIMYATPNEISYAQYSSESFASIANGIRESYTKAPNAILGAAIGGAVGFAIGYMLQLSTMWNLIMGTIIGLIFFAFMFCKIKKFKVTFTCNEWERPTRGDCNVCNQIEVPCTKYRCESLGQTCYLINEGTREQMCIDKCNGKESVPEIKPWEGINRTLPSNNYTYRTIKNGFEITKQNGECIEPYTKVDFGIKLVGENDVDAECKFSQCKISTTPSKSYEEMENFFGDRSAFLPYHKSVLFFPSPEALRHQYNLSKENIRELSTVRFYVRCKSVTGQINPQPYVVQACVSLGPDLTPPFVQSTVPEKGTYLPHGKESVEMQLFVNEPAICRYSTTSKNYDEMEHQMECETDVLNYTDYGWECKTTLTEFNSSIFIKCRDISENKNTMSESYEYNLIPSDSPLLIKSISPHQNEEIVTGEEPTEIRLKLETIGGAENGKAVCSWAGNSFEDKFTDTDSNFHSYLWKYATSGEYHLNFTCTDIAENIATNSTSFKVLVDNQGPVITRVYKKDTLRIMTNENSECRYSLNKGFLFENASQIQGDKLEHSMEWNPLTFYVQCIDSYKNKGNIFKIKAYDLII